MLASYPEFIGKFLGIVYRTLSTHLINKAGFTKTESQTGTVVLIQRFGWYGIPAALNLNARAPAPFHMMFLDALYAEDRQ